MTERAYPYRPFTDHLLMKPTGVAMAKLAGEVGFINLGNYETASMTIESDSTPIYTPQTPEQSQIATLRTITAVRVNLTMQQLTPMMRAAVMQSDPDLKLDQVAAANQNLTIAQLGAGRIFPLGYRNVSVDSVKDADDNVYVEGVHYQYDAPTGHFEIIRHFDDVERADVTVGFDAAAVTGRKLWGIASQLDLRGAFMFQSTNRHGPRQLLETWDMGFAGDGEFTLGANSTDQASVPIVGTAYSDPTRPLAYAYGRVTDLPRAA